MRAAVRRVSPRQKHRSRLPACCYSFLRPPVARRSPRKQQHKTTKGSRFAQREDAASREARSKLVAEVETSVRHRLTTEFPRAFGVSWFRTHPALSSLETLLELNGFRNVAKPSGNKGLLYLAEGVVATPPAKLSWNANTIPFASGYQEFARGMDLDNVGVFGDVRHLVKATKNRDRLFAQPIVRSKLHPGDGSAPSKKSFPEFVQEDITLYRLAEKSAARFLDSTYTSWTNWTHRRFVRPLNDARYRTRIAIKSANAVRARLENFLEKSIVERIWEGLRAAGDAGSHHGTNNNTNNNTNHRKIGYGNSKNVGERDSRGGGGGEETKGKRMNTDEKKDAASHKKSAESVPPSPSSANSDGGGDGEKSNDTGECVDPLETLVVISYLPGPKKTVATTRTTRRTRMGAPKPLPSGTEDGDEIVDSVALYRQMTPSTRILALSDYYVLRHSSASTLLSVSLVVFGALPLSYRSYVFSIDYDWLVGSGSIAASVVATITYGIYSARVRARTSQSKAVQKALGARVGARDEAALLLLKEGAVRSVARAVLEASEQGRIQELTARSSNGAPIDPREWAIDFGLLNAPPSATDADADATTNEPGETSVEEQRGKGEPATIKRSGSAEKDPFEKQRRQQHRQ